MRRAALRAALLALAALAAAPTCAQAEFGIAPGGLTTSVLDSAGELETRAGAHPDLLRMQFTFNTNPDGTADGNVKDISIDLPSGFIGDPRAVPTCTREQFSIVDSFGVVECPPAAQIGTIALTLGGLNQNAQIFNLEPGPDGVAEFAFRVPYIGIRMLARMRPDGSGLSMVMLNSIQDMPLITGSIELWGVPADHQTGTAIPRRPFLTLPTGCDGPAPEIALRVSSWQEPETWKNAAVAVPALTGCEGLSFAPQFQLALEHDRADTPIGVSTELALPQNDDPKGQSSARVRYVDLLLPEGVALSPGAGHDLAPCAEAAVGIGSAAVPDCPPGSRLGTAELTSPVLFEPLRGTLYLGGQLAGTAHRIYLAVEGPGMNLKIVGTLTADPVDGRLTARLVDLPELPLDRMTLTFAGGPRAPLTSPLRCGSGSANATLTPYGGVAPFASSSPVSIASGPGGAPCARWPFAPGFAAGSATARAGQPSPFSLLIRREDGEQLLDRFTVAMPPGLSAGVAGVGRCSAAAAEAAACPAASRIGSFAAEVGSGPEPYALDGEVFLTGPYRGAPFGFALVLPGRIGPFDLGTIVTRARLRFDPDSGQATVESDPLPRIVKGIPLRLRTIALAIDRPGFMVNPTSCTARQVTATLRSTDETVTRPATRFAVGGCAALPFAPKVSVALTERRQLRAGGRPGLRMRISPSRRGANVRAASVRLPKAIELDAGVVTAICSREQARDGRCPAGARVGSASGRTPLVDGSMRGSVYVVQPRGSGLPDLWARLEGSGLALNLRMEASVRRGRISTRLVDLPDFPLSDFTLRFASGKRGLFELATAPCGGDARRRLAVDGALTAHTDVRRRLRTRLAVGRGCSRR